MTASPLFLLVAVLGFLAAGLVLVYHLVSAVVWSLSYLFRGVSALLGHVLGFVRDEAIDGVQTVGAALSSAAITPLALGNLVVGRMSAVRQYGRALGEELTATVGGVYRLALANPLRLLGLGAVVRRVEGHLPEPIVRGARSRGASLTHAHAPNVVEPPRFDRAVRTVRTGRVEEAGFEGYDVTGELPAGGSGARLFLARPHAATVERLREGGVDVPSEVVIKAFAIAAGSTLPQIVREGRALEAARKLGLVLQHSLDDERFWYVMPYVRGRELGDVTTALHVRCGAEGLDVKSLRSVASYTRDVLDSLERFHADGLWHKDVKPSNVVVAEEQAHLVDLGLVTPLASAMTLTTHGTEYYRDPELVRQALRGAKVNEVDGVKFDLYAVGALLYSMVENSFPAHGNLSRITKNCPEALSFVVRRAMADHADRYSSALEMREDLAVVAAAKDPFAVRPLELPSFRRAMAEPDEPRPRKHASEGSRTLRVGAEAPAKQARAEANANPSRTAQGKRAKGADSSDDRVRHRRRHGLATFALMFFGILFVARILPTIVEGTDVSGVRGNEDLSSGWFAERLRRFADDIDSERPNGRSWASQAEAQAAAEEAEIARVVAAWRSELGPLISEEGAEQRPAWSRGEHVLVLDDVRDASLRPDLGPVVQALEESGYGVIGTAVGRSASEFAIDVEASARNALGLASETSEDAVRRLQEFLDAAPELDAVLWIAPDEEGTSVERMLLLPTGVPRPEPAADQGGTGYRPPENVVDVVESYGLNGR